MNPGWLSLPVLPPSFQQRRQASPLACHGSSSPPAHARPGVMVRGCFGASYHHQSSKCRNHAPAFGSRVPMAEWTSSPQCLSINDSKRLVVRPLAASNPSPWQSSRQVEPPGRPRPWPPEINVPVSRSAPPATRPIAATALALAAAREPGRMSLQASAFHRGASHITRDSGRRPGRLPGSAAEVIPLDKSLKVWLVLLCHPAPITPPHLLSEPCKPSRRVRPACSPQPDLAPLHQHQQGFGLRVASLPMLLLTIWRQERVPVPSAKALSRSS